MKIALVTTGTARSLDEDLPSLETALRMRSAEVSVADWDDPEVDWSAFDIALLRSTWDYTTRLTDFLEWAERAAGQTTLHNPLSVVRWNTDKHYLADLAAAGVPVVSSAFIEPGEDVAQGVSAFLRTHSAAEFVIKPAVGAGSRDARRYAREDRNVAVAHAQRLADAHRSVLMQPYMDTVDEHGETSLIYLAGQFSHAIRKDALLHRGKTETIPLLPANYVTSRVPSEDELRTGAQTLAAIPFGTLLYTRVDLIRDAQGAPHVLELELTEPSLFLGYAEQAVDRFATAIVSHTP